MAMTDHNIEILFAIINCVCIGVWLGSLLTYIFMSWENQNPRVLLLFWLIGIVLSYPWWLGIILDSIMALWSLYDIYKLDRKELEDILDEIRKK
jgi:hypothetical protein